MTEIVQQMPRRKRRWLKVILVVGIIGTLGVLLGRAIDHVQTSAKRLRDL